MHPIAVTKDNQLELLLVNFSGKTPNQLELDTKLKYTIDMLAWNRANKDMQIVGTRMHLVKQNKDLYTTRSINDYERLKSSINGIDKSIQYELYYPRETYMCNSCAYRNYCRAWK